MSVITEINWREAYENKKLECASLERERANLWGVNEQLREKIAALENGTDDLQEMLKAVSAMNEPPQDTL